MRIVALKDGTPKNDYHWTEVDLEYDHPDSHENLEYEERRARGLLALMEFIRNNPDKPVNNCRVEYDSDLRTDILVSRWNNSTYEFYVEMGDLKNG